MLSIEPKGLIGGANLAIIIVAGCNNKKAHAESKSIKNLNTSLIAKKVQTALQLSNLNLRFMVISKCF